MYNQNITSTPFFLNSNSNQNSPFEASKYTFDKNKIENRLQNMKKKEEINISPITLEGKKNSPKMKGLNSFNLNSNKSPTFDINSNEQNDFSSNENNNSENEKNNNTEEEEEENNEDENEENNNEEDEEEEEEEEENFSENSNNISKDVINKNYENENKRMIVEYIKVLFSLENNNKSIKELIDEFIPNRKQGKLFSLRKISSDYNSNNNDNNMNNIINNENDNNYNVNNSNNNEEKQNKILFDFDNDIQTLPELDYETELICNISIPKIVCLKDKLYLMYITPNLKNDYNIFLKQLENEKIYFNFFVSNLTTCFRKNNKTFTIQLIHEKNFTKLSYDIITKNEEDCENYVNGINYLIRNRKI